MALVDSQAAFKVHCDKIDVTGWLSQLMVDNQLNAFQIWVSL